MVLGVPLSGFVHVGYALTFGAVSLYVGYGLYQMSEAARRVAIGVAAFILADSVRWLIQSWTMPPVISSFPIGQPVMKTLTIGVGCVGITICAATILYLIARRNDFSSASRVEANS